MCDLSFSNLPPSPNYRRIYGSGVNRQLLQKKSPYLVKDISRFAPDRIGKSMPLRPVNVLDFPPHPSKDIGFLYEYYFPESAADHEQPSVAEMTFLQRKLEEREGTQRSQTAGSSSRSTSRHLPPLKTDRAASDSGRRSNEQSTRDVSPSSSRGVPPGKLNSSSSTARGSSGQDSQGETSQVLPWRSITESKENRMMRKEWKHMTPGQKDLYSEYVERNGEDWRNPKRDEIWHDTLERIEVRVRHNDIPDAHQAEVKIRARNLVEEKHNNLVAIQEEKEARQAIAQQNRLNPTQIRKLAVIATKEWKKFDFARKKEEKERKEAAAQRKKERKDARVKAARESNQEMSPDIESGEL